MRSPLPYYVVIGLLGFAAFTPFASRAQSNTSQQQEVQQEAQDIQDTEANQDEGGVARVARLASLDGQVSFQRAGDTDWVAAVRNLPLLPGDQLYTGPDSHARIQLDRDSFIWLSPGTALTISDFSNDAAQFDVTSGSAMFQIARLAAAFSRFEVDTQVAAIVVSEDGVYRLRVHPSGQSQFAVKQGAAEVTTSDGDLTLRDQHQLTVGPVGTGELEVAELDPNETWDVLENGDTQTTTGLVSGSSNVQTGGPSANSGPYDARITASPDYVTNYEDTNNGLYGLDDLSTYGTWTNVASYGDCWVPNVGAGWAPYRLGEWVWVPAAGWTWLSSEPWGWAPYHYGRWSFVQGLGWAWVPGFGSSYYNYGYSFYQWNPAPVYFFNWNTPQGPYVGWFPLPPGTPAHRHWHNRPAPRLAGRVASLIPTAGVSAARSGGVSIMPVSGLTGAVPSRPQPAGSIVNSMIIGANQAHRPGESITDGLPAVTPIRSSVSPLRAPNGAVISAMRPPQSAVNVPVITRRIPPATIAGTNVSPIQHEHRLVEPKVVSGSRFGPNVFEPGQTSVGASPGSRRLNHEGGATPGDHRWSRPQGSSTISPRSYIPEHSAPAPHVVQPAPSGGGHSYSGGGGAHPSGGGAVHSSGGGAVHSSGGGGHSSGGRGH